MVIYGKITEKNFSLASMDGFDGRQQVTRCWRRREGRWALVPAAYVDDSAPDAGTVLDALRAGDPAFGAWEEGKLVGLALLTKDRFGSVGQYVDLAEFYVSRPFRRRGIGERLFALACRGARELGAKKLYISAHSAQESIAAYRKYGCVEAEEIYWPLAKKEPCDVQMEYGL